jgi:Tol biopolymer transport system component
MRNKVGFLALGLAALASMGAGTGVVRQITDAKSVSFDWPMLGGTGNEVLVINSSNQFGGGNPDHLFQVVSFDPTTGVGTPLTSFTSSLTHFRHNLSVSDDGQKLAFISDGDLIPGQNGNRNPEAFVVNRDGTGLTQLTNDSTPNPGSVTRLALAGSGNRVTFASTADLTGGNPNRVQQVFVVDFSGSNLMQLTQATEGEIQHLWISDDGTRLAFSHNGNLTGGNPEKNSEVFTIAVGDALPRQVTSSVTGNSLAANISGNGATIVFHSTANLTGGNADGGLEIFAADWATATVTQVTNSVRGGQPRESKEPWPTNDGSQAFFVSNQQSVLPGLWNVYKINTNGTGLVRLTSALGAGQEIDHPVVSGDGSRFGVWADGGLYTATGSGTNLLELIDRSVATQAFTDMSADGQWVSFSSDADPLGTNPSRLDQIFVQRSDGTGLTQLTDGTRSSDFTAITGDGSRIYYLAIAPVNEGGPNNEIFGINRDGTGLIRYTDCSGANPQYSAYAEVSDDGATVVFVALCDHLGTNPDNTGELFRIDPDGQNLIQLTSAPGGGGAFNSLVWPRLDATGTWVVFSGDVDLDGGNADNHFEVWRMQTNGTNLQRLTTDPVYDSRHPDISASGSRIVFESKSDLVGQNSDHNSEIFLYEPAAVTPMRQLTHTTNGQSQAVRISRDGAYAYFSSTSRFFESPSTGKYNLYRYHIDTDTLERAGGLRSEALAPAPDFTGLLIVPPEWWPGVNTDGSRVAFSAIGNGTGDNPDDYWDVQVADYNAPNPPLVSPGLAPTTITFEPEPGSIRYDVIRGDVAELQDAGGGIIDLGTVLCVENDSGDTTTAHYEDQVTPIVGQAFFYAFRGSMGILAGPGSYGTGSNGSERVAGTGDCAP